MTGRVLTVNEYLYGIKSEHKNPLTDIIYQFFKSETEIEKSLNVVFLNAMLNYLIDTKYEFYAVGENTKESFKFALAQVGEKNEFYVMLFSETQFIQLEDDDNAMKLVDIASLFENPNMQKDNIIGVSINPFTDDYKLMIDKEMFNYLREINSTENKTLNSVMRNYCKEDNTLEDKRYFFTGMMLMLSQIHDKGYFYIVIPKKRKEFEFECTQVVHGEDEMKMLLVYSNKNFAHLEENEILAPISIKFVLELARQLEDVQGFVINPHTKDCQFFVTENLYEFFETPVFPRKT